MDTRLRQHISHKAKSAKVPVKDVHDVFAASTVTEGTDKIYRRCLSGKRVTRQVARERYSSAKDVLDTVFEERQRGKDRRERALRDPHPTVQERKVAAITRLLPFMPSFRYSGDTTWEVSAVEPHQVGASTKTSTGDQYSKRCTYKKTDAVHTINVCLLDLINARKLGVPASIDGELVIAANLVKPDIYRLSTITTQGRRCRSEVRHAAKQGVGMWYLGASERGAVIALNKWRQQQEDIRSGGVSYTTCRDFGWCRAGIIGWCSRHGIKRDLAKRLQRGASTKAISRLIVKHGGPQDAYERKLINLTPQES